MAVRRSSLCWVVLISVLAACSLLPAPGAPAQFVNRLELPSCGQEVRAQGEGPDVAARECLISAFDEQRPAEFVVSQPTIEGDPIATYYRVWPSAEVPVEVYNDSSRDQFRSAAWTHWTCERLVPMGAGEIFQIEQCSDQQVLVR